MKDNKNEKTNTRSQINAFNKEHQSDYTRSLIEASLDPLVTINPNGKITDVNKATIQATGATKEELIGSVFSDYFTDPKKAKEGYKKVLKEGIARDYALTIKHKNGKLTNVLYNASVYKDEKGNILGVFAAARDITKSKQASEYARSLIEASVDPLVTISPDGKITDVNKATIQATGILREALIGTNFSQYFTETNKAEEGYQKVLREGSVKDYPLTIRHQNGTLMEVSYNASTYKDATGAVIGVFAAARDVTETRRASQYARSLIEASLDPLVTINPNGKITDVNKATVDVTGATKEELIGSDFSQYFTQPEKASAGYQEVFQKGVVRDYLLTVRSKTGKLTPVLYNASVYKDEKGNVLGVFAAAREIGRSELKAAQARELQRISKQTIFKVALATKLGKGSIKLNESDAKMLGLEIVDNATVKPSRDELLNRKITAMSMTSTRIPKGIVFLGLSDFRTLGLEEDDTVSIIKAGTEEEIDFVDAEQYEGTPGEYDSPELQRHDDKVNTPESKKEEVKEQPPAKLEKIKEPEKKTEEKEEIPKQETIKEKSKSAEEKSVKKEARKATKEKEELEDKVSKLRG